MIEACAPTCDFESEIRDLKVRLTYVNVMMGIVALTLINIAWLMNSMMCDINALKS